MGACQGCTKHKKLLQINPILQFLREYQADQLIYQWDKKQLEYLNSKIQISDNKQITYSNFLNFFPALKKQQYSQQTKKKFYQIFNFSKSGTLRKDQLLTSLTIIKQTNDQQLMAQIVYQVYKKNKEMTVNGLEKFMRENKEKLNDGKKQEAILSKYVNGKDISIISLQSFHEIFQQYDYTKFIQIFNQEDKSHLQQYLAKKIKQQAVIDKKQGDIVYILDYRWFLKWKSYMKDKYDLQVIVNKPHSQDSLRLSRISRISYMNQQQSGSSQSPGIINNHILIDNFKNQLKPDLAEFRDFVIIPRWLWLYLIDIYGGGPSIMRNYPEIYMVSMYIVSVDGNIDFEPFSAKIQAASKNMRISTVFQERVLSRNMIFYKSPGNQNWQKVQNNLDFVTNLATGNKIYLCPVPNQSIKTFTDHYNVHNVKNQSYIQKRVKNYGSIINAQIDGIIIKALVLNLQNDSALIQYRDSSTNNFVCKSISYHKLSPLNPRNLEKSNKKVNYLAGMSNYANNCYMNSVVQCLIRTDTLRQFIRQAYQQQNKQEQSLVNALNKIIQDSKKKQIVNMQKFKKVVQKKCPMFQGQAHQDGQQFLLAMMQIFTQEIKLQKQFTFKQGNTKGTSSTGTSFTKSIFDSDGNRKKKIQKYFCGQSFAKNKCMTCENQTKKITSFFTYSLSLPQYQQFQQYFFYIPYQKKKNWQPIKYGLTLSVQATITQFLTKASNILQKQSKNLQLYAYHDGQIIQFLRQQSPYKQMQQYKDFGMKLACQQIKNQQAHYLQLRYRSQNMTKTEKDNKSYKLISSPMLLQVIETTTWKDIQNKIYQLISGQYELKQNSKKQKPYKIRIINKLSQKCAFCKKPIKMANKLNLGFNFCKQNHQCKFQEDKPLYKYANLINSIRQIVIVVQWNTQYQKTFKGFQTKVDESVKKSEEKTSKRYDQLSNIFTQNFKNTQEIQLRCEQQNCTGKYALRKQGIQAYPNILLVHLIRFRYKNQGLVKMKNVIKFPQIFQIGENTYQLYGCVVHVGNCSSGHYYSYVKVESSWFLCNDQKVTMVQKKEYLDEKAYILWYKKKDFDFGLRFLAL